MRPLVNLETLLDWVPERTERGKKEAMNVNNS